PRRLARARRAALLPDPGGGEADLLAEGDRARARRPRRDGQPWRHDGTACEVPPRPRRSSTSGARDTGRARLRRRDRRGSAAPEAERLPLVAESALHAPRAET